MSQDAELLRLQELTNHVIDDFKYMYNYNVEIVRETSEEKKRISQLNKKITDLEIEKQQLEDRNSNFLGAIIALGCANLWLLGGLLVWLL